MIVRDGSGDGSGSAIVREAAEERDALWADLERIASLCGRTADEHPLQAVRRVVQERDELQAKLDAELPAAWREDLASLNECLERVSREVERLRAERRQLRARLVECRPWVGVCPYPNTPGFTEMLAIRDLADDTLEEVKL